MIVFLFLAGIELGKNLVNREGSEVAIPEGSWVIPLGQFRDRKSAQMNAVDDKPALVQLATIQAGSNCRLSIDGASIVQLGQSPVLLVTGNSMSTLIPYILPDGKISPQLHIRKNIDLLRTCPNAIQITYGN
jgi:hypothetical protein